MADEEYHKFGSNPPFLPVQPEQQIINQNFNPYNQQSYNQQYCPPIQPQLNSQPLSYPPPQYDYNYGQQPQPQINSVYGQPIYIPVYDQAQPLNARNNHLQHYEYHSALQCLSACLVITTVYQFVIVVILGINGNEIYFPSNVTIGFLCAIVDFILLSFTNFYFKKSEERKNFCYYGIGFFFGSSLLFILTYIMTFSSTYYYRNDVLYHYTPSPFYLVIQCVFRSMDLIMAIIYLNKRFKAVDPA